LTGESVGLAAVKDTVVEVAEEPEPEREPAAAGLEFAEMAEEPSYKPLPRDYSSDFGKDVRGPAALEELRQPATALFPDSDEASLRELDTPTFLRRFQF